jgi:hypothetical protein
MTAAKTKTMKETNDAGKQHAAVECDAPTLGPSDPRALALLVNAQLSLVSQSRIEQTRLVRLRLRLYTAHSFGVRG